MLNFDTWLQLEIPWFKYYQTFTILFYAVPVKWIPKICVLYAIEYAFEVKENATKSAPVPI